MHALQAVLRRRAVALRPSPPSTRLALSLASSLASNFASPSRQLATRTDALEPTLADKLRTSRAERTGGDQAPSTSPQLPSSDDANQPGTDTQSAEAGSRARARLAQVDGPAGLPALRIPARKQVRQAEAIAARRAAKAKGKAVPDRPKTKRGKSATLEATAAPRQADEAVAQDSAQSRVSAFEGTIKAVRSSPAFSDGAPKTSLAVQQAKRRPTTSPQVIAKLDQISSLKRRIRKLQRAIKPWDELSWSQRYRQIHFARNAKRRALVGNEATDSTATVTGPDLLSKEELEKECAERWPEELDKLRAKEKSLMRELSQTRDELAELRALPVPKKGSMVKRDGPPLMERIARTLPLPGDVPERAGTERTSEASQASAARADSSAGERRGGGRIRPSERRQARAGPATTGAAAVTGSKDRYTGHPALRDAPPPSSEAEHERAPDRELSSYQHVLSASDIPYTPRPSPLGDVPVATLAHSLDRVLFNPGVHFLRDPRTGVYNFARDVLEKVPKVAEFDFAKLPQYITSSQDETLAGLLETEGRTFAGSTSSTIGMLCQIYFWLSKGKPINTGMLSTAFRDAPRDFSMGQQLPASVVLHYNNGRYSIDADKSFDAGIESNILAHYGHLMEKLLTTEADEFKRFLHDSEDPAPSEADHRQAYHYGMTDHLVLRSQLDAHNPYLPNKTFDLKTRGTVAIRQDRLNYEESAGYVIDKLRGPWESFEREYYDLIRSAFLKYQFQARIGCMDGIFVAYHSTARFYGFQYVPVGEMDDALFGNSATGDAVFRLALGTLETLLRRAKDCYPGESVNATFAVDQEQDVLRVFVARQADLEAVEDDAAASAPGSDTEQTGGSSSITPPRAFPMTLLEVRGTSYLDGEAQHTPVTLPDDAAAVPAPTDGSPDPLHPNARKTWQLAFDITASSTASPARQDPVEPWEVARLFARTRAHQQMFSSLYLPTGISPAEVREAQQRAREAGVELDESDLALRFPVSEGLEYTSPSRGVKALRRRAREGETRRREEEARRRGDRVVEVRSRVVEREDVLE